MVKFEATVPFNGELKIVQTLTCYGKTCLVYGKKHKINLWLSDIKMQSKKLKKSPEVEKILIPISYHC